VACEEENVEVGLVESGDVVWVSADYGGDGSIGGSVHAGGDNPRHVPG